jgi:hypothetical protein
MASSGLMGTRSADGNVEEFLAGATSGQAAEPPCFQQARRAQREGCELTGDSAGLTRATPPRRRGRFPMAFWEVNAKLARPN